MGKLTKQTNKSRKRKLESVVKVKTPEKISARKTLRQIERRASKDFNENDNHSAGSSVEMDMEKLSNEHHRKTRAESAQRLSKMCHYGNDLERAEQQHDNQNMDEKTVSDNETSEEVTEFEEGDNIICMQVDPSDNFLSDSEDEDQNQVTQSDCSSEGECHSSDEEQVGPLHGESNERKIDKPQSERTKKRKSKYKESMENKLDTLSNSVREMQEFIREQVFKKATGKEGKEDDGRKSSRKGMCEANNYSDRTTASESDTTIYRSAVKKIVVDADSEIAFQLKETEAENEIITNINKNTDKEESFEDEEQVDTSDDLIEDNIVNNQEMQKHFIADCQA